MFDVSTVLLQNAFETVTPDACKTFRHVMLHIKSPTGTNFPAVQLDHGRRLSFCLLLILFRNLWRDVLLVIIC